MFFRFTKSILVASLMGLMGCQTTTTQNETQGLTPFSNIIVSEPLQANFKQEIQLAKLSEIISTQELTPEQFAQAFYDRGFLYDSLGLPNLARLDFNRALRANPKMAEAYNFVGIHYTLVGQFDKAYEAFDATLELAPGHQYAYLNRGISLYYGDDHKLAAQDFTTFQQFDVSDPYRAILLYLAEYEIDKTAANKKLRANRKKIDPTAWGLQIIDLFLMNMTQQQFVSNLDKNIESPQQLAERLCEAYFYLGKFSRMYNQPEMALNYFKLGLATNVFEFIEHRYARRELLETRLEMHQAILKAEEEKQAKAAEKNK